MNAPDIFSDTGFLSTSIEAAIPHIRNEDPEWFQLAEDTNIVLMRVLVAASEKTTGTNWAKETVAVRLLMRASGSLQGVILLLQRGMIVQGWMLVGSIIEDSFCAAALIREPDKVIKMLRDDAEASRPNQAKFISMEKLGDSPDELIRLDAAIEDMDKSARLIIKRRWQSWVISFRNL